MRANVAMRGALDTNYLQRLTPQNSLASLGHVQLFHDYYYYYCYRDTCAYGCGCVCLHITDSAYTPVHTSPQYQFGMSGA
jgi:hypothetical protein